MATSTSTLWLHAKQTLNQTMKLNFPKKKPSKKALVAKPACASIGSVMPTSPFPPNVAGHLYDWKWRNELKDKVGGVVAFHTKMDVSHYLVTRWLKAPWEAGAGEPKAIHIEKMKELWESH